MIPKELQNMKPLQPGERLGQNRESEYLGAEDIDPGVEPVLTIAALYSGKVTLQRGKEMKDVIAFVEERVPGIRQVRPLIVNATNRKTLRKLFGSVKVEVLTGKQIQLYIDHNVRDPSSGDITDGIRIRNRVPKQTAPAPIICADCGAQISGFGRFTAEAIAQNAAKKFGVPLCMECGKKRAEAVKQETAENAAAPEAKTAEDGTDNNPENKEE